MCTAVSVPEIWPAQSCTEPVASWMSALVMVKMAFAMIRLAVSPIPIGRTPGHLLRAISRRDNRGAVAMGSTMSVHRRLAETAREWHRLLDAALKEVHSLLQQAAFSPEGPAEPVVLRAVDLIRDASIWSYTMGWISGGS